MALLLRTPTKTMDAFLLKSLFSDQTRNRVANDMQGFLPEALFLRALSLERKRAERSRKLFVLMLLERMESRVGPGRDALLDRAVPSILRSIRETDIAGWHRENSAVGVIFAELGASDKASTLAALRTKVTGVLQSTMPAKDMAQLRVTFHCFPDDWRPDQVAAPRETLYPDLVERDESRRVSRAIKRATDVLGSSVALTLLAPILLLVALAVKLSSPGPILYRQKRIGQYGVPFSCLKFRSMYTGNDPRIHMEYVKQFIEGRAEGASNGTGTNKVYKITRDPRLTGVGRLLRKASLDELPQFFNVLRGEMSLVGPRPPIPYEIEAYDVWHRRRLFEVKPGITGLWQVNGRSRLKFDDMVRLDLRYATTWSLWLDLKILARTPQAVFSGEGAY